VAAGQSRLKGSWALLAAAVIAAAGCGGTKQAASTTTSQSGVQKPLPPEHCPSLSAKDVTRVTGISSVNVRGLARFRDTGRLCGTIYFGSAGSLLVQLTEDVGAASALRRLRASAVAQFTRADVRPMPEFGDGAFLARRRILAFQRGGRIVTIQTGYQADGRLSLTVGELSRLGRLVAAQA
jgi:hypothetical protein